MNLIALNKPFGTICQFSAHETRPSLGDWVKTPGVYAAGRLDADSEGLLLLTDDGGLQARIAEPRHKLVKRYWAQVDGAPGPADLKALARGVDLGDYVTRPCRAEFIEPPRHAVAAQSADPLPRRDPDHVDRAGDHRGQEPAGAPDDGGRRLPHVAPGARRHRRAGHIRARHCTGRNDRAAAARAVGRFRARQM
ncbi:Pseudouridine synthase, Rsu, partial [Burkholderia cenocepacia PC184]